MGDFFKDVDSLNAAQSALESQENLQGKKLQVFESPHFYSNARILIQIQDPSNPENINEYIYRNGSWKAPTPVRLEEPGNIRNHLTPLEKMPFSVISSIEKTWNQKAQSVEGAEQTRLSHVYLNINPSTGKRRWFCDSVTGTKDSYFLTFNLDGSVENWKKN